MDPKACVKWAWAAADEGDVDGMNEQVDAYREWRRKGGFEPFPGADLQMGEVARLARSAVR